MQILSHALKGSGVPLPPIPLFPLLTGSDEDHLGPHGRQKCPCDGGTNRKSRVLASELRVVILLRELEMDDSHV